MMRYALPGTLDYYRSAPYFTLHNASAVPVADVVSAINGYYPGCGTGSPDEGALAFYTLNHLMAMIEAKYTPYEQLPDWAREVAATYLHCVSEQSRRLFYYLLLICTRESRHIVGVYKGGSLAIEAAEKLSPGWKDVYNSMKGHGSLEAAMCFLEKAPKDALGNYVKALHTIFDQPTWASNFGGKAWAAVTHCLLRFVTGDTTMEMMLDTAYTLAHNNGPIFNKGMMYTVYTKDFTALLDVQRAGKMPELVLSKAIPAIIPTPHLVELVKLVQGYLPGIEDSFSWQDVVKAGAISKQAKDWGAAEAHKAIKTKGVITGQYYVMPNKYATIIKQVRA